MNGVCSRGQKVKDQPKKNSGLRQNCVADN